MKTVRCAIYTRKSSEEGLEQDFNSLDAQRESCEAYIRSQAELGWKATRQRYEDGGFSGGTLERPGLQRLLSDLKKRLFDVVVIYKIDRLTRSLADFSRLAELFEAHNVSFVSVTQQFNTATSMGRLMLNVLLSFAQFEREITGERIRDKIAASKQKGMWMGGIVPLGYDVVQRQLIINSQEAETVRRLFSLYLDVGHLTGLYLAVREQGLKTKARARADGTIVGGSSFSRGHLHRILSNPLYRGQVRHRDKCYPGQHEAIIDEDTWGRVQALMATNRRGEHRRPPIAAAGLLSGLLYDETGARYVHSHTTRRGRRYRYYVLARPDPENTTLRQRRIPADQMEESVRRNLGKFLRSHGDLALAMSVDGCAAALTTVIRTANAKAKELETLSPRALRRRLLEVVEDIVVASHEVRIRFSRTGVRAWLDLGPEQTIEAERTWTARFPHAVRYRGRQMRVVDTNGASAVDRNPNPTLVKLLRQAHAWRHQLEGDKPIPISHLAAEHGVNSSYFTRILRLAYLAPDITEAILGGRQPADLTAARLLDNHSLPIEWSVQRSRLGFPTA